MKILLIIEFVINAILAGLLVLICGLLGSWVLSVLIYGFGELIEQAAKTANYSKLTYELQNNKNIMTEEMKQIEKEVAEFEKERY